MKLLVVFAHLIGVCLAIGTIILTDLRLLARVVGYHVVIPPPSRFETRVIAVALGLLVASGTTLVVMSLGEVPGPLANEKLLGKLMLVSGLVLNALVLHHHVFPWIERGYPVADWDARHCWTTAASVGLSNSLWFYCAFLGIARPWNHAVPLSTIVLIALALWAVATLAVRFMLTLASREEPRGNGDWIDAMKTTLSGVSGFGAFEHEFETPRPRDNRRRSARPAGPTGPIGTTTRTVPASRRGSDY